MKKLQFIALAILFALQLSAQQKEEAYNLQTETGELKGSLLLPESDQKLPVVLMISGSGPTDRNGNNAMMQNNSLKMLAEGLAKHSIASVRFDKRGVGESKGAMVSEADLRFEHYIQDVKEWIAKLQKDGRFSEVIVLGHSEGSTIGMIAIQDMKVGKYISVAGPGFAAGDIIRKQLKAQPPVVLQQAEPILAKLEKGELVEDTPAFLAALFRPSVQPYMISWMKYDPSVEITKVSCPVLLVQGTTDIQVKVEDVEALAKANPKVKKLIVEGMNHVLKEAEADRMKNFQTYNNPELPLKSGLIEGIVTFVKE
ncbi:alpha/beta hydrolase [Marinifilum sp. D737]|uniref:alpha/beta hydrolase n=1 Tax=Marinifilum sp. D737 TaxID=2969628 RepID=UPI0022762DE2|nr:alpha/beta fold hydrolase [Marinifilum sp. D737]MCY1636502.1 lysophospholipase [Marinifilum sp. D737]